MLTCWIQKVKGMEESKFGLSYEGDNNALYEKEKAIKYFLILL